MWELHLLEKAYHVIPAQTKEGVPYPLGRKPIRLMREGGNENRSYIARYRSYGDNGIPPYTYQQGETEFYTGNWLVS